MQDQHTDTNKVVLVTGSSSGFGRLSAETLARQGYTVYASMRDLNEKNRSKSQAFTALVRSEKLNLETIELDVTEETSVGQAIDRIMDEQGQIDVLINNAGAMNVGITEGYTSAQIRRQMDVNFFAPAILDRAVIPHMREQGSGLLIHVSSLAGRLVFPYFGIYCASKFALEALAEAYRYELSGHGIDSVIVEPGPFGTSLISNSPKPEDQTRISDYGDIAALPDKMLASFEEFYRTDNAINPQVVADDIAKLIAMNRHERPLRTVSGLDYGLRELNHKVEPVQRSLLETLGLIELDPALQHSETRSSDS